jgi:putative restriction endonuclease
MFDAGAIYINDIWIVCDGDTGNEMSALRRNRKHDIDRGYVKYHREHHAP